ncbi:MAG: transglycosylase family protein [Austwickia sp.]|nr:transglycosylase family protein [Austwickia sp.]
MHYTPKHAAPRRARRIQSRVLGAMAAGGATIAASVMTSAPAQADSGVWDRVAACESGGNWSISTGNGFYGGLQFTLGSWRAAGGSRYAAKPHHASRAAQIAVAQNLLRMQGPGAWPVCSRRAGLTRANGLSANFASVASVASVATWPLRAPSPPRACGA